MVLRVENPAGVACDHFTEVTTRADFSSSVAVSVISSTLFPKISTPIAQVADFTPEAIAVAAGVEPVSKQFVTLRIA